MLERCEGAGQQEHQHEDRDGEQRKLRHGVRDRGEQDAERRHGEQINGRSGKKQFDRADDLCAQDNLDHDVKRERGCQQYDQPVCPDLAGDDLAGAHRHNQKMLDCSMLPFPHHRGTDQNDGEDGDIVDDAHAGREADGFEVRVEHRADHRLDGGERLDGACLRKRVVSCATISWI